ncbi:biotin/lipoyl-containing protein [Roseimarinus sediminis]|uniref:biotin/lipoyl-containing protein n=1 Tax=Roseimarinus sediminis TaxID=1610899 RepID=UPI003D1B42CA
MENIKEEEYGEYSTFSISSGLYRTELTEKFKKRLKWQAPDPKKIIAIIPGTILDVFVKPGQQVAKGEVLLLLEAMKMQNQITMPFDGKIKKVNVKADEVIKKLHLMIEIA